MLFDSVENVGAFDPTGSVNIHSYICFVLLKDFFLNKCLFRHCKYQKLGYERLFVINNKSSAL